MKKKIYCPHRAYSLYFVELDSSENYPDDPGNGTPIMLYGPQGQSVTYNCAIGEGEFSSNGDTIPERVLDWLCDDETLSNEIDAMYEAGHGGNW